MEPEEMPVEGGAPAPEEAKEGGSPMEAVPLVFDAMKQIFEAMSQDPNLPPEVVDELGQAIEAYSRFMAGMGAGGEGLPKRGAGPAPQNQGMDMAQGNPRAVPA